MAIGNMDAAGAAPQPDRTRVLHSVQAGRGIAALLVVLFHGTILVQSPKYWGVAPASGAFTAGHSGVYFFFVLSGFIILWAHDRDIDRREMLRRYLWKRAIRIYPPLMVTLVIVCAMMTAVGQAPAWSDIVTSLLLVGPHAVSIIAVGWTLFHELLFYILFAGLIISRKLGILIFIVWALVCLIDIMGKSYYNSPLNYLFMVGMAAALFLKKAKTPVPGLFLALGGLGFVTAATWQLHSIGRQLEPGEVHDVGRFVAAYGLASCLLLLGGVELERAGRLNVPRILLLLGNASYSIYLVHYPVLSLTAKLVRFLPEQAAFPFIVICATSSGILFWTVIEKPLGHRLSTLVTEKRAVL